jgi:hypothetical protein
LAVGGISDGGDDDEDLDEAQARREDQQRFPLGEIVAGHEDRLRSAASYRIPTSLLQSGAATPSREDNADHDKHIGSRPTSPAPSWNFALPVQSRAATPAYIPADTVARDRTPLFLPGSRDPTPFLPRKETPYFFPSSPQYNVSQLVQGWHLLLKTSGHIQIPQAARPPIFYEGLRPPSPGPFRSGRDSTPMLPPPSNVSVQFVFLCQY